MRPTALLACLCVFGVPALALQRRDDQFKGNGKPYEDPADKGGRMLTVSPLRAGGRSLCAACSVAGRRVDRPIRVRRSSAGSTGGTAAQRAGILI